MCGIFASNDPLIRQRHEKIISYHLNFRGPDYNSGLINFANWKLYHSRLSIIAPDKKYNQPYLCEDGSILLYNGEIFNFKNLAKKLTSKKIISDTELLSKIIVKKKFSQMLNKPISHLIITGGDSNRASKIINTSGGMNSMVTSKGYLQLYNLTFNDKININDDKIIISLIKLNVLLL